MHITMSPLLTHWTVQDVQVGGRGPLGPPTGHQKGVQTRPWTGLDMSIDGSIGLWRGRAARPPH